MAQAAELLTDTVGMNRSDLRSLLQIASALGQKDEYTHAHAYRVAYYAKRLAICAGLPMAKVMQIAMGGMLHDAGKLALSDTIFSNRKAALSKKMLREVYTHPLIGAAMLRQVSCPRPVFDAVLFHHERMDGSGYPFGLKGEAIPQSARIVSIADCFDAITTDRPYQKRKSCASAIVMLEEISDTCLDAKLVRLFIREIRSHGMTAKS
jgi:HD-GYP domain-containing protein (c-di-GMP phosphodiesterase class II)